MQRWEGEAVAFVYMGCGGVSGSRGDKESLDLKQTDRRNGGSCRLDADATAEERQGGLETISETVQSTLLAKARPAELPWKLAASASLQLLAWDSRNLKLGASPAEIYLIFLPINL